jgi:hypothetical protein
MRRFSFAKPSIFLMTNFVAVFFFLKPNFAQKNWSNDSWSNKNILTAFDSTNILLTFCVLTKIVRVFFPPAANLFRSNLSMSKIRHFRAESKLDFWAKQISIILRGTRLQLTNTFPFNFVFETRFRESITNKMRRGIKTIFLVGVPNVERQHVEIQSFYLRLENHYLT